MYAWMEWIKALLNGWEFNAVQVLHRVAVIMIIILLAWLADVVCRRGIMQGIRRITRHTKATWDDMLFNERVTNHFCHIIPPVIFYALLPWAFTDMPLVLIFIRKLCLIYILATVLRFVNTFLGVIFELVNQKKAFRDRPLKGIYQIIQVALFFVGAITIIGVLVGESPLRLLAGLGASAAILMLVFKDSIVGLVSGIQLSANDMLRPGDWITMPKYNADGTVIEVTLNTVKVRNFDNTITTIPPYALVSDAFQNWRGMEESEGRRIKRFLNIDMHSVCFCTTEMLERFRTINLLKSYIEETQDRIRHYNEEQGGDISNPANGLHQTNLGVFRAYLERYIAALPEVNMDMTCMVRQLQPTEKGLPLEVYFFCKQKSWVPYEKIQADVFDHILAVIPQFGLRVFQSPSDASIEEIWKRMRE